jgi:hypothetical protein
MTERVQSAHATCRELKRWLERVEDDEQVARSQVARLGEELNELLPHFDLRPAGGNIERFDPHSVAAE